MKGRPELEIETEKVYKTKKNPNEKALLRLYELSCELYV